MSACSGATAVVVAGGSGSRIGGEPKQFRLLGGRPLLSWSCARFRSHPGVEVLVVVLPAELAADPPGWLEEYEAVVVAGGESRQASVRLGLEAAGAAGGADGAAGVVLIHDAARPFASEDLVSRLLEAAAAGPVIPVVELADAIKRIDSRAHTTGSQEAHVESTVDRSRLRAAQTPQAFPLELIRRLHARAAEDPDALPAPDDATLCETAGVPVRTIAGERNVLKITHAEDLAFAEWLVETGRVSWPKET